MSTMPLTSPLRSRRTAVAIISTIAILSFIFVWYRLIRPSAPAVSKTTSVSAPVMAKDGTGKAGELVVTQEAMQLAEITIAPAKERIVAEKLVVSGSIDPGGDRLVNVTPRVSGKIVGLSVVA